MIAPTDAASVSAAANVAGKIDEKEGLLEKAEERAERGRFGEKGRGCDARPVLDRLFK